MWTDMKWSDHTDFWGDRGGTQGATRSGHLLLITYLQQLILLKAMKGQQGSKFSKANQYRADNQDANVTALN